LFDPDKLPVLVDGDVVMTESAAIPLYLAEKYPEKGLIPSGLADRAQMYRWIFFLVTEIVQPLWRIALNTAIYPVENRVPADIENATRDCKKMVAVFEGHMTDREFVAGDHLSVADFNAAYTLDWANEAEMLGEAPRLREYLKKMYARPTAPMTIKQGFAALKA
jgi:glutathione S-transferase